MEAAAEDVMADRFDQSCDVRFWPQRGRSRDELLGPRADFGGKRSCHRAEDDEVASSAARLFASEILR